MSFQASTWAAKQDVESSSAKFILLLLANYADADGFTFVGQKTLAEDASMSRRTVVRHMGVLEEAGLIVRSKRFREDGSRSSDGTYLRLDFDAARPSDNLTSGQKEQGPSDKNDIDQVPNCHSNNLLEEQSDKSKTPFQEFCEQYPHPKNKGDMDLAERRFKKLKPNEVMAALRAYRVYVSAPEQNWYSPAMAASWLKGPWKAWMPEDGAQIQEVFTAVKGTPEHDAWSVHKRNLGVKFIPPRMTVPSPFPPVDPAQPPMENTQ